MKNSKKIRQISPFLYIFFASLFLCSFLISCNKTKPIPYNAESYSLPKTKWTMIQLPTMNFPGGVLGTLTISEVRPKIIGTEIPIWMAETNTTYALWSEVYDWAENNGYTFNRHGRMGSEMSLEDIQIHQEKFGKYKQKNDVEMEKLKRLSNQMNPNHPVTIVDWCTVMIWCNALTEYYNLHNQTKLRPVYSYKGTIVKDATNRDMCDNVVMIGQANGFRLPLGLEWELAARYTIDNPQGTYNEHPPKSSIYWKSFLEVSGEVEAAKGKEQGGGSAGRLVTVEVKQTAKNNLGFYGFDGDNGKLWQWCFEYLSKTDIDTYHLKRGGSRGPRCSRHENWPKTKWGPTCGQYTQITFRTVRSDID